VYVRRSGGNENQHALDVFRAGVKQNRHGVNVRREGRKKKRHGLNVFSTVSSKTATLATFFW
jgi:hypothetical protein